MEIDKDKIVNSIEKGLEQQFTLYSWDDMIDDIASVEDWTEEEKEWAKQHTTYDVEVVE